MPQGIRPHIILVVARGEAVRNFLYSDTLRVLAENARVTLLSIVDHGEVVDRVQPYIENIISLKQYQESPLVVFFREVVHTAHYRWLWSEAVKYYWGRHDVRVRKNIKETLKLKCWRILGRPLANRHMLRVGTNIDRLISFRFRPTDEFDRIFSDLKPDLVFNCSHIHGPQADLPMRVAAALGIPTAVFVFSWDNLTSRSRIFPPYNHFLMWNDEMAKQLLDMYRPEIMPEQVHVTGTPQFDFHYKSEFHWSRERLCQEIGLDPDRPFILYTTGMASDFPEEHRIVAEVIRFIKETDLDPRPQLVVRTYIKGTGDGMLRLAECYKADPDVVFPPILWDRQWVMPLHHDLYIYTSLLLNTALGINAASTVSLELMMLDKPCINLGFEPPGANLPQWGRFSRHIDYEHYRPVAQSGGVMVARSIGELKLMIRKAMSGPYLNSEKRKDFIRRMMGDTLDGKSGQRVAEELLVLAKDHSDI